MHCASPASLPPLQMVFTAISLCAPVASGLAMAFPVFALSVYQLPGGHPDNPLGGHSLDTEQGSWFGQHPLLLEMMPLLPQYRIPSSSSSSILQLSLISH